MCGCWMGDIIEHGNLTTPASAQWRSALLGGPALIWLLLFLVLPGLLVAALAFASRGDYGQVVWSFTWDNLSRLMGNGVFGWSADYLTSDRNGKFLMLELAD